MRLCQLAARTKDRRPARPSSCCQVSLGLIVNVVRKSYFDGSTLTCVPCFPPGIEGGHPFLVIKIVDVESQEFGRAVLRLSGSERDRSLLRVPRVLLDCNLGAHQHHVGRMVQNSTLPQHKSDAVSVTGGVVVEVPPELLIHKGRCVPQSPSGFSVLPLARSRGDFQMRFAENPTLAVLLERIVSLKPVICLRKVRRFCQQ